MVPRAKRHAASQPQRRRFEGTCVGISSDGKQLMYDSRTLGAGTKPRRARLLAGPAAFSTVPPAVGRSRHERLIAAIQRSPDPDSTIVASGSAPIARSAAVDIAERVVVERRSRHGRWSRRRSSIVLVRGRFWSSVGGDRRCSLSGRTASSRRSHGAAFEWVQTMWLRSARSTPCSTIRAVSVGAIRSAA